MSFRTKTGNSTFDWKAFLFFNVLQFYRALIVIFVFVQSCQAKSITLQLPPEVLSTVDSHLHLEYFPPYGTPPSNLTFNASEVTDGVSINNVLSGTDYTFHLYYTNASSFRVWTALIKTEPEPPINLLSEIEDGKVARLSWEPPNKGNYTGFRLKVVPVSDEDELPIQDFHVKESPYVLRDLTPGGSYEIRLYTVFSEKESQAFASTNFTTRPSPPGRFIVWFRNDTTLLVLWQPPYPSGVFDRYQVTISPPDAVQSVLYVEKEGKPPGPAQAAFYGLVPGRAYNISVHTVSGRMISNPTEAQYRTIPLPPTNVTVSLESITSYSLVVEWSPPKSFSEFDRYQVSLGFRSPFSQVFGRDEERIAVFNKDLNPGQTYEVLVKTLSGNVGSWEITKNITTRPLPVMSVNSSVSDLGVTVKWFGHNDSIQDSYVVKYSELDAFNSDNNIKIVEEESINIIDLLPGRNYSIHVSAASKGILSDPVVIYQATKPTPPIIESSEAMKRSLNISWKADVTSHQEWYSVIFVRNDTREKQERTTTQTWLVVDDLYPGAIYEFNVYAISNGLWSDPVTYLQSVSPNPPEFVAVSFNNSSMDISWQLPSESLVSHFLLKYKASDLDKWKEIGQINNTTYVIKDLVPGEKYDVEIISVNNHVQSVPVKLQKTLYPNSIKEVQLTTDAYNVSFTWVVPEGRIDHFLVLYHPITTKPSKEGTQQIPANETKAGETAGITIYDLTPGELYAFLFFTVSYNLRSEENRQTVRTLPVIDSVINIVTDEHATRTLLIRYTPTPVRNVVFDRYRIQLSDPSIPAQEKLLTDDRLVIFDNLVPGRLYNISIWTVSRGVRSNPIQRQARLYPEPVDDVFATSIRDDEITLAWNAPPGDKDRYEVEYQDHQGRLVRNVTALEEIAYTGMKPHHNYTFLVTVLSGYDTATVRRSRPVSQTFQTRESVPGKIHRFDTVGIRPNEVTLKWTLPSTEQNGVLTGFNISYFVKGSRFLRYALFEPMEYSGVIHNLVPGKTYIFEIQAHTKVGPGAKSRLEFITPIWAPPSPGIHVYPTEVSHTSSTIRIRFRKNFFSEEYGPVIAYSIIAAEDETRDSKRLEVASWSDVQGESVWPPYQVVKPYYPFRDLVVEDFTIGTENCKGVQGYCNGPLKSSTKYRVKIRAFTAHANFSDTAYSHPIQTDADNKVLIIIILVTLSLILLVVIIVVILKKRRAGVFAKRRRDSHGKEDGLSITETELVTSRPIKLKDFADHYHIMSADSDFRFSEEFELLKHVGRDKPCAAADLPVNRPKNRFTNILPYDHSRIKLLPTDDEEGSDYINANYIPGFNSPREFIVTQGPLHSTHDDFWRMVWEQNSRAIVMLTRCIEKGREKCDHYWPYDMQPVYYGDIQVTILNESQYPHWTISEFKVSRGEQSRIVRHFHFTTWPDFGVPDPPQVLVKFVRAFRERVIPDSKPVIVHCSAGVGRSGTLIALDHLLQHINKYDFVDIFGIVYEMRKERVWMVQNEQQYICIHQCLLCVLEGKEDVLDSLRPEVHDNQGFEDDEGIAESGI